MYFDRTLLGQSKSGSVFRSIHPHTGHPVLLKILPWDQSAPFALNTEMMLQLGPQLMQVGQFGGFNIARLLAVEQLDEGLGLVSEYFPAPTVAQYPGKGTISAEDALDVANQLIHALCEGEKLRMIHGDVKPSNVLIGTQPDGRPHVKLTDWGINQARANHPLETLLFRAPEHLDGSAPTLRGDLFSVGCVLYFLLTGTALIKGRNLSEISSAWVTADPEQLKKGRKDLPSKFLIFVLTLLDLKRDKRPANPSAARALLAELLPPPPQGMMTGAGGSMAVSPGIPSSYPPPASTVAVQGPMRPPTSVVSPITARVNQPEEPVPVQVVAMRPPPEIAAKLNLPATPQPMVQPGYAAPPAAYAPPPLPQSPPMLNPQGGAYASGPQNFGSGQASPPRRRPQPGPPPTQPASPLYLILTLLVVVSLGVSGYFVWKNWDKLTKGDQGDKPPEQMTSEDLRAKLRGSQN